MVLAGRVTRTEETGCTRYTVKDLGDMHELLMTAFNSFPDSIELAVAPLRVVTAAGDKLCAQERFL
eukprot:993833-Rhodomonas_salina.1